MVCGISIASASCCSARSVMVLPASASFSRSLRWPTDPRRGLRAPTPLAVRPWPEPSASRQNVRAPPPALVSIRNAARRATPKGCGAFVRGGEQVEQYQRVSLGHILVPPPAAARRARRIVCASLTTTTRRSARNGIACSASRRPAISPRSSGEKRERFNSTHLVPKEPIENHFERALGERAFASPRSRPAGRSPVLCRGNRRTSGARGSSDRHAGRRSSRESTRRTAAERSRISVTKAVTRCPGVTSKAGL